MTDIKRLGRKRPHIIIILFFMKLEATYFETMQLSEDIKFFTGKTKKNI